ncbi:unnamed protein product [Brassicogethes aeneus]|uniref:CHK kinase-like domain-containing protein n=1 Tax=Brassicogethes aeneus TaxID=1431903 RepID=A0A9P0FCL3_BRAAE|nr:unnamed protein product [Brassicogethes aeneus]
MPVSEVLIQHLVLQVMKNENYATFKIDTGGNTARGDGYLGDISFITVTACRNGIKKPYRLVVKAANPNEAFREKTPIEDVYKREVYMYTTIFPSLYDLCNDFCVDFPDLSFAKVYTSCLEPKKESIVLQNMKTIGFDLHSRLVPMNLNHAHMVFSRYGKFHGLSMAMRHKKSALFQKLTKDMTDLFGIFLAQANMVPSIREDYKTAMKLLKERGRMDLVRKYENAKIFEDIEKITCKSTDPSDPASVILHGDCWNNNFMFKYDGLNRNQPTDMIFIDFQLSRVASPVYDLAYYAYACLDKHVLSDIHYLLEVYYKSLLETLDRFGINVNDFFSFDKIISHWKQYGKYGLLMSLFIVRVELSNSTEAPDFAASAEKGNLDTFLIYEIANQAIYDERILDNLIHFAENFI